ncbi:MAG TPA: hypothetical protein VLC46_02205 [Thermoanaerobaculia bacterium]|jgi:hypothetical protein|nr:hypothetical protein [Thermoanaerobaculia bacterium]
MNATLLYRIAAVLFVLFAAGHTFGFLKFKPPTSEGIAVRDAMKNVHFHVGSRDYSYGGFHTGFGLSITVYLLFFALLAWHLGNLAAASAHAVGMVGWALFAVQVFGLALSCVYFPPVSAILSGVIAVCLGLAAWFTT